MDLSTIGKKVSPEDTTNLMTTIYKLLSIFEKEKSKPHKFIGNHPITLTFENIPLLLENDYMVAEKTDGIRVLLFIGEGKSYFYDRKNEFYEISLKIPSIGYTIIDGELFDEQGTLKYGAFDCIAFDSVPVVAKDYLKRLYYCKCLVDEIHKNAANEHPSSQSMIKDDESPKEIIDVVQVSDGDTNTKGEGEGNPADLEESPTHKSTEVNNEDKSVESKEIQFFVKQIYKSYGFLDVYKQIKDLRHGNDGLIFTPVKTPYVLFTRVNILKWKPPSINTVDFKIKKSKVAPNVFNLICGAQDGSDMVIDNFMLTKEDLAKGLKPEDIDGEIAEFSYDKEGLYINFDNYELMKGGWKLYKIRNDKESPNNARIVSNIVNYLEENLTIEELSRYFKPMMNNYKYRESKDVSKGV